MVTWRTTFHGALMAREDVVWEKPNNRAPIEVGGGSVSLGRRVRVQLEYESRCRVPEPVLGSAKVHSSGHPCGRRGMTKTVERQTIESGAADGGHPDTRSEDGVPQRAALWRREYPRILVLRGQSATMQVLGKFRHERSRRGHRAPSGVGLRFADVEDAVDFPDVESHRHRAAQHVEVADLQAGASPQRRPSSAATSTIARYSSSIAAASRWTSLGSGSRRVVGADGGSRIPRHGDRPIRSAFTAALRMRRKTA